MSSASRPLYVDVTSSVIALLVAADDLFDVDAAVTLHDDRRERVRLRPHDERALIARRIDRRQRAALIGERAVDPVRFAAVDDLRDDVVEEKRRREVVVEVAAQLRVDERRIRLDAELAQERGEEERFVLAVAVTLLMTTAGCRGSCEPRPISMPR